MNELRISQSLIKDYDDYVNRQQCGKLFYETWITRSVSTPPSEAMMLGQWFELLATGTVNRHMDPGALGEYFIEGMKASGKNRLEFWNILFKDGVDLDRMQIADDVAKDFTAKYVSLHDQAVQLRRSFEYFGITPIHTDHKVVQEIDGITRVAVFDVVARVERMRTADGELMDPHVAIIDLKATGLFNDKWSDYGWDTPGIIYRPKLTTQAIDYLDIVRDLEMKERPTAFYFFVHSNTNAVDRKIVEVRVHDSVLDRHREKVRDVVDGIELAGDRFTYYPSYARCRECPLFSDCLKAQHHPFADSILII